MRGIFILCLLLFQFSSLLAHRGGGFRHRFVENKNQWNSKILYRAEIRSGALFLEKNCFTYHLVDTRILSQMHGKKRDEVNKDTLFLKGHAFKVHFLGSNENTITEGAEPFEDHTNYYLGKDPKKWASNVTGFTEVNYSNLYQGIDLKIFTQDEKLKYEFRVLPGVDASQIRLKYEGVSGLSVREGSLIIKTSVGNITEKAPYVYQIINGRLTTVPCYYAVEGNVLTYKFPKGYNKNQSLIIDPTVIFSTYSGSLADNFGYTATFDSDGFLFAGGTAFDIGYPVTPGAYQTTFAGGSPGYIGVDIAITKYDTTGTKRIYSTYLGGHNGDEMPHSLIVNDNDELFLFGTTGSSDFPVTSNAYDTSFGGGPDLVMPGLGVRFDTGCDIIITRFSKDGSALLASTYMGGRENDGINNALSINYADEVRGEIEIDQMNNVYIATCTFSTDFPVTPNAFQPISGTNSDACIFKLTNDLTTLVWSSYFGGSGQEAAYSLELDTLGNIYFAGGTTSTELDTTAGALYPTFQGVIDGFITHINNNADQILHCSYFSSSRYDQIYFVDLDNRNNVFVFGQTTAPGTTFVHNALFNQPGGGQFITKMTPELDSLIWSTVFGKGGVPDISPTAFLVDLCSKVYLAGWGGTIVNGFGGTGGLIITPDAFQKTTDNNDFYFFVLEDDASKVSYASFYGGPQSAEHVDGGTSRFDRKGKIYHSVCAGCGAGGGFSDFPIIPNPGAVSPTNNSGNGCNNAVFKIDYGLPVVVADFKAEPGCAGTAIQFINKSLEQKATSYKWYFGDGSSVTGNKNPTHIYARGGRYTVTLILTDNFTCNLADTIRKTLDISDFPNVPISATTDQDTIYRGRFTYIHAIPNKGYNYVWSPSGSLSSATDPNPRAKPDTTTIYTLTMSDPLIPMCKKSTTVKVNVIEIFCIEPYIYVPNSFTPDGDGQNDVLYVRSKVIQDLYFTVYDRWGEKVFETRDQNKGWDGTYKGMKADPGVFVYYLETTCVNEEKFFKKGNVTLIR